MTITIPVFGDNEAVFVCPQCNESKTANVSRYMKLKPPIKLKAKCKCGHAYSVILEKRDRIRKKTNLVGRYMNQTPGKEGQKGQMTVLDISRTGLKSQISQLKIRVKDHDIYSATVDKASFGHQLKKTIGELSVGDELYVEFHLDDSKRSLIKKQVIVRWVSMPFIGVEFSPSTVFESALGFYMMS